MITKFESYSFNENKDLFFFKPTNRSFSYGNLCYLKGCYSTYQPGKDYQMDVVTVRYNKDDKQPHHKITKPWITSETIHYSYTTYRKFNFLTAEELFKKHTELVINIHQELVEENSKALHYANNPIPTMYNALLKSESLRAYIEAEKYNL